VTDHLRGTTAIVTGSSQGIGREVALRLAREGAAVVVNGTGADPEALPSLVADIEADGGRAVAVTGSVAEPETAEALVASAHDAFGRVDALVNVAGIAEPPKSSVLSISVEEWAQLVVVHLHGTFLTCRAVAPLMTSSRGGVIVNTTSHAFTGMYGGTGYAAAKGGVNSLTYALAADLAEHGIRVNAVAPGARTRLSSGPDYEATIASLHERGVLGDDMRDASLGVAPAEFVAPIYAFLASAASAPITGTVFSASGMYVGRFGAPREELLAWEDGLADGGWSIDALREALRTSFPDLEGLP
jgi:3-oxoacyl-[acyl-carrier protein] reductase